MRIFATVAIVLFCFSLLHGQSKYEDESFNKFIGRLQKIALQKDVDALKMVLHDTIFESIDICGYPGCSKSDFFQFHFTDTIDSDWQLLSEIIGLGFAIVDNDRNIAGYNNIEKTYEAPAYMRRMEWSENLIIIEKATPIKKEPDANAEVIMVVDSGIFACNCCLYNNTDEDEVRDSVGNVWIRIFLDDRTNAYVEDNKTSQRFYKILRVALIQNEWKIIVWYTGEPC